jgi:zinc protease
MKLKTRIVSTLVSILWLCGMMFAQSPDRSAPPSPGPVSSLKLPEIQHYTLSNKLPVLLLEKHNLPLLQVELIVHAGTAVDPEGKTGLASMTAAMMEEGAGTRNSLEFADAVDYLGATISAFAGWHSSGVSLHTPVSKIDSALSLFADMVLRPRFPAEDLERQRKDRLTTLMQWRDEPGSIASILSQKVLYGDHHPYGLPVLGNEMSLRSMKVDDLKNFYSTYFRSNNATIVIVGDVTAELILPKLEILFGGWPAGDIPQAVYPEIRQVQQRTMYLVDKPGAAQSEIIFARMGAERATSDYYALQVMNDILGGAFTSRLNQNLREEHGYTYGAGSTFDCRLLRGPFTARAAVQTAVTANALMEFMNEMKRILLPVNEDELIRAKNYITLRYPRNFESVENIADRIVELVIYHLPDDYFNKFTQNILAVDNDDVLRVSNKYIDPENLAIIVVGDRKQIEKGIADLNLGPVKYLQVEDVLGAPPSLDESH